MHQGRRKQQKPLQLVARSGGTCQQPGAAIGRWQLGHPFPLPSLPTRIPQTSLLTAVDGSEQFGLGNLAPCELPRCACCG